MEKLNIAKLLKDCPKGMELYSPIFGTVYFNGVKDTVNAILVEVITSCNSINHFYPDGKYNTYYSDSECLLFPSKDQRDWSKFHRPFKDGDILFIQSAYSWILIYKDSENKEDIYKYAAISGQPNHKFIVYDDNPLCCKEDVSNIRFATEEEKQKLFKAIKENGYKWNPETKTLENVVKPNLKVGDRIIHKASSKISVILDIVDELYIIGNGNVIESSIPFSVADSDYELIQKFEISTLIPFESRVLVRDFNEEKWCPAIWGIYNNDHEYPYTVEGGNQFLQCIPYDGNEHLIDTTDKCDDFYKTWE